MRKSSISMASLFFSCFLLYQVSAVNIQNSIVMKSRKSLSPSLKLRNGAIQQNSNVNKTIEHTFNQPLTKLQLTAFLQVFSNSLVMFSPAPVLVAKLGSSRATSILSMLSASSAFVQILFSPIMGSILDSTGRKQTMFVAQMIGAFVYFTVSLNPTPVSLCGAKFIATICSGFSALSAQAMISDITASNPAEMSSVIGFYAACLTGGFLCGTIAAGQLSEFGLSVIYGIASLIGALSFLLVKFGMLESLPMSERIPFQSHSMKKLLLQSPISSIRLLLRHGSEVRILAIVLMLQTLPQNMGDFFQVFAKTEWKLTTKGFSSFIAMYGVLGITANITGSVLVKKIGIKRFTVLAILSSLISPIGSVLFGFRGMASGALIGFLASAQSMGVTAALISEGVKSGTPQGELAGERTSLLALLKIVGPIWYSLLYSRGEKFLRTTYLPFVFNIGVGIVALVFSQIYLP